MRARALLLLLGLVGCGPPTEVVLRGDSDLTVAVLGAVEVLVTSSADGSPPQSRCVCLSSSCAASDSVGLHEGRWPFAVGLQPGRTAEPQFTVELIGHRGGRCDDELLRQKARVRFQSHRRRLLRMSLSASCLDVRCDAVDQTCRDGTCTTIDFPLEAYDPDAIPAPPDLAAPDPEDLAGADLAGADLAGADLAGADLADADLAGGPVGTTLLSGGMPAPGPPAIARYAGGYAMSFCRLNALGTPMISDARVLVGKGAAFVSGCRSDVVPAIAMDAMGRAVTWVSSATGSHLDFIAPPSATALLGPADDVPRSPAQLAIMPTNGLLTLVDSTTTDVRVQSLNGLAAPTLSRAPLTAVGGIAYLAASSDGASSNPEVAIWYRAGGANLFLLRTGDAMPGVTAAAGESIAAATIGGFHFLVANAGTTPRTMRYASAPYSPTIASPSFIDFTPPLVADALDLVLVQDQATLVLAYTDGVAIFEQVLLVSGSSLATIGSPTQVTARAAPSNTIDHLGYAASGVQGGGRYVWRELTMGGGEVRTRLRNPALP